MAPPRKRYTAKQAARMLGVSVAYISWLLKKGYLKGRLVGKNPRWSITGASINGYREQKEGYTILDLSRRTGHAPGLIGQWARMGLIPARKFGQWRIVPPKGMSIDSVAAQVLRDHPRRRSRGEKNHLSE